MMKRLIRAALLGLLLVLLALLAPPPVQAGGFGDTLEQKNVEWLFKQTAFGSAPTQLWFSLHGSDPGDTCANELAATGSYARAQLNPDANAATNTNWEALDTVGSATRVSNKLDIVFPTATANWNSGNAIPNWCARDASTGGTCLLCGTIGGGTGVVILNGNTLRFNGSTTLGSAPGQLKFQVD